MHFPLTMVGKVAVCILWMSLPASAQVRSLVETDDLESGVSLHAASTVVSDGDGHVAGEAAVVTAWTRRARPLAQGVVPPMGFRGPRWTDRFGTQLAARISGDADGLQLDQRFELALYAFSVGQTVSWQGPARLTDRMWSRARGLAAGAFVDFPGLGFLQSTRDGSTASAEGLPVYVAVSQLRETPVTTFEAETAVARISSSLGEARLIGERLVLRDTESTRSMMLDLEVMSARRIAIAKAPGWRWSGAVGFSYLNPSYARTSSREVGRRPSSFFLLARVGVERTGATAVRTRRSELGRPLLVATELGAELATMHREIELVGVDAGLQISAWWRRHLDERFLVSGEAIVGGGARVLARDPSSESTMPRWREVYEPIGFGRLDLALACNLVHQVTAEARVYAEYSERLDLESAAGVATPAWSQGAQLGLSWQR